jgi:hypothetical protein
MSDFISTVLSPGQRSHSIADAEVKDFRLTMARETAMNVQMGYVFASHYYNIRVGCWEPLVEDWEMELTVGQPTSTDPMEI